MAAAAISPPAYTRTFGARVWVPDENHTALMTLAESLAHARHTLFKRWAVQGEGLAAVKREITARFGLSSRQFNAIRFEVQQEVAAWRGRTAYLKTTTEHRLTHLQERIRSLSSSIRNQTRERDSLARRRQKKSQRIQIELQKQVQVLAQTQDQMTQESKRSSTAKRVPSKTKTSSRRRTVQPRLTVAEITHLWQQARDKLSLLRAQHHRLNIQVVTTEARLVQLTQELEGTPRVCFGGKRMLGQAQRKLDQAQSALRQATSSTTPETAPLSVARRAKLERRVEAAHAGIESWKAHRASHILYVGSKDEPSGNASAVYDPVAHTLAVTLRPQPRETRLPRLMLNLGERAFARNRGQKTLQATIAAARAHLTHQLGGWTARRQWAAAWKTLTFVPFPHVLVDAEIQKPPCVAPVSSFAQHLVQASSSTSPVPTAVPGAITWRLRADPEHDHPGKGHAWQVYATVDVPAAPVHTHRAIGGLGVDVNADHLACTLIDRFGNATRSWTIPFPAAREGLSAGQQRALVESAVLALCREAAHHQVPLIIEALDFQRKKAALRALGPQMAQMLSGLAYRRFETALTSRAAKDGVEVITVNPAFTSQIGQLKYRRQRPSLSIHQAAAWVIARRGLSFTERVPFPLIAAGPARNQPRSRWNRWRHVSVCEPGALPAVCGSSSLVSSFARGNPTLGPPR